VLRKGVAVDAKATCTAGKFGPRSVKHIKALTPSSHRRITMRKNPAVWSNLRARHESARRNSTNSVFQASWKAEQPGLDMWRSDGDDRLGRRRRSSQDAGRSLGGNSTLVYFGCETARSRKAASQNREDASTRTSFPLASTASSRWSSTPREACRPAFHEMKRRPLAVA